MSIPITIDNMFIMRNMYMYTILDVYWLIFG